MKSTLTTTSSLATASSLEVATRPSLLGLTKVSCVCRRFATLFGKCASLCSVRSRRMRLSRLSGAFAIFPPVMAATDKRRPWAALEAMRLCILCYGAAPTRSRARPGDGCHRC